MGLSSNEHTVVPTVAIHQRRIPRIQIDSVMLLVLNPDLRDANLLLLWVNKKLSW